MINDSIVINREQLYKEIWEISLTGVAKKYELNYSKLINICKENNIPYPTSAYWTKKSMGIDITNDIILLPKSEINEVKLYLKREKNYIKEQNDKLQDLNKTEIENQEELFFNSFKGLEFLDEDELKKVIKAIYELDINKHKRLHKKIVEYKNKIEEKRKNENNNSRYSNYSSNIEMLNYFENISKFQKDRIMKLLSCIYYLIEDLGGKINDDLSMIIRNQKINIEIAELQDQVKHELTKDEARQLLEYEDNIKRNKYAWKPNIRKYDYLYNGKLKIIFESRIVIRENDKTKLEDKLDEILINLYEKSERVKILKEEREELDRIAAEEKRKKEELNNRKKEEALRVKELVNKAEDYRIACEIRNYISAIKSNDNLDEKAKEMIEWANKKADWFDPIIDTEDELLGKRKHGESLENKNNDLNAHSSYFGW